LKGNLTLKIINVVINKKAIKWAGYPVLEKAFTYSIQRIENDLKQAGARFLIITDEGRVGKMRQTARRIQRFNPIPSKFGEDVYRKEIENLVEDPLPKNSKESYFIQLADMVSYVVGLHQRAELGLGSFPGRLAGVIDFAGVQDCLDLIKPSLNLKAAPAHTYGIVCYPKQKQQAAAKPPAAWLATTYDAYAFSVVRVQYGPLQIGVQSFYCGHSGSHRACWLRESTPTCRHKRGNLTPNIWQRFGNRPQPDTARHSAIKTSAATENVPKKKLSRWLPAA